MTIIFIIIIFLAGPVLTALVYFLINLTSPRVQPNHRGPGSGAAARERGGSWPGGKRRRRGAGGHRGQSDCQLPGRRGRPVKKGGWKVIPSKSKLAVKFPLAIPINLICLINLEIAGK